MKKTLLYSAIVCLSAGNAFSQAYIGGTKGVLMRSDNGGTNWKHLVTGTSADVNAVYRKSSDTLYFGTRGSRDGSHTESSLMKLSIDKGESFTLDNYTPQGQSSIGAIGFFKGVNADKGYIFVSRVSGNSIGRRYTSDNGTTWSSPSGTAQSNKDLSIADSTHAWLINNADIVKISNLTTFATSYVIPAFRSIETNGEGVAVVGDNGMAYTTSDSGATWEEWNLPGKAGRTLNKVRISPNNQNIVVVGSGGYCVYSNDGGDNFSNCALNIATTATINEICFISDNKVILGAQKTDVSKPLMYVSENGGASFVMIPYDSLTVTRGGGSNNHTRNTTSISFASADTGWLVQRGRNGNESEMLRTANGGLSWGPVLGYSVSDPMSIHAFSYDVAVVGTSTNGRIVKTVDGGATWTQKVQTDGGTIHELYYDDVTDTLYAAANNGVWKSADMGETWISVNYEGAGLTYDINKGYLAGASGRVFKTKDYSTFTRWYPQGHAYGTFNAIHAVNRNVVYAVGINGFILKTLNGGTTWSFAGSYPQISVALTGVHFFNQDTGYVVGEGGLLLKTENGGVNWTATNIHTENLNSLKFADANKGMIIGNKGLIFKTIDAGATWQQIYSGTQENLMALSYNNTDEASVTATPVGFALSTLSIPQSSSSNVQLSVKDFNNVRSFVFQVKWDPTVFEFSGANSFALSGLTAASFDTSAKSSGILTVRWSSANPVTLSDAAVIANLGFKAIGAVGESTTLDLNNADVITGALASSLTRETQGTNGVITVDITSSYAASHESAHKVYPNPNSGQFFVESPGTFKVEVYGSQGLLLNTTEGRGSMQVNLQNKGIYTLRITHPGGTEIRKVVIQ